MQKVSGSNPLSSTGLFLQVRVLERPCSRIAGYPPACGPCQSASSFLQVRAILRVHGDLLRSAQRVGSEAEPMPPPRMPSAPSSASPRPHGKT
jgi:hypothetical protein